MSKKALDDELKEVLKSIKGKAIRNMFADKEVHLFTLDRQRTIDTILQHRVKIKGTNRAEDPSEDWKGLGYSKPIHVKQDVEEFVDALIPLLINKLRAHKQVRVIAEGLQANDFIKVAVEDSGKKPYTVLSEIKKQATAEVFSKSQKLKDLFGGADRYSPTHIGHETGVVYLRGAVAQNALMADAAQNSAYGGFDIDAINKLKDVGLQAFNQRIAEAKINFQNTHYKEAKIANGVLMGVTEIETELQGQFYNDIMQANLGVGMPYSEKQIGKIVSEAWEAATKAINDHYKKEGVAKQFTKKGSPSLRDDLIGIFLNTTFVKKASKRKGTKIKVKKYNKNPKSTAPKKSKKEGIKQQIKSKDHGSGSMLGAIPSSMASTNASRRRGSTESAQSTGNLLALLNAKLPQTVAKNMGPPGLENQTGRFASSVRVTDVNQTAQGHPSVGYTYQKNPYQVFEMTHGDPRWATPQRDPRNLIDASIREIAAQFAIGRFYTRRV